MCGRFTLTGDIDFYADYFGVEQVVAEVVEPSWNVAPTDRIYTVSERDGERLLGTMRWGLIPSWATDDKGGHINARAETVATNPTFRDSFARHRCLIPADGFYEWEPKETGRSPHFIRRADGHPFAFAGVWANWRRPADGEWVRSCAIITTKAEGAVVPIHHRMPVALASEVWAAWMDRDMREPEQALELLQPIDSDLLMEHEVSRKVNDVRNNGPELIAHEAQQRLI